MVYQQITEHLKRLLSSNLEESFLIISPKGNGDVYAQFLPLSQEELYCETVSNEFLPEKLQLNSQKISQLKKLGFELGEEDVNFHRDFEVDNDTAIEELSKLVLKIFVEIYGVVVTDLDFEFEE